MSNRQKIKPERLGRRRVDAFYPVVYDGTDQDATTRALVEAAVRLRDLTGPWKVGGVQWRRYLGREAVVEVLTWLRDQGAVPGDARHLAMIGAAHELGDRAVLALPCQQMLAGGATTTAGSTAPAGHRRVGQ